MEEIDYNIFAHHYPPEILNILVSVIPKLFRSKKELLLFFRGAGATTKTIKPYEELLLRDRNSFNMYHVTRDILAELNEQDEQALFQRREIIKRVKDFTDFEHCYDNNRYEAMGLVSQLQKIVTIKDNATKENIAKADERRKHIQQQEATMTEEQKKKQRIKKVQSDLYALIVDKDPHKRGKALEKVLNELFSCYGILVREAFTVTGDHSEGVIEQIDGAIELEGGYYLVEMKWWKNTIGIKEMSEHLVRIASRGGQVRGIFISYSKYSEPAILGCHDALNRNIVMVLITLDEIVKLLEDEGDLKSWLGEKIAAAVLDKKPYVKV